MHQAEDTMTGWPIGLADGNVRFAVDARGALYANAVCVSDASGWVVLQPATSPEPVAMRVEVAPTPQGPMFYACEIRAGGRSYQTPGELLMCCATLGSDELALALRAVIARHLAPPASSRAAAA